MKSKRALLDLGISTFVIISLLIITLILGIILLSPLLKNIEDATGQKIIDKSTTNSLLPIKTSVYPEKAIKGTSFKIDLQVSKNDSQGITLAKAIIENKIVVLYDDGTHGDSLIEDRVYSGIFDSSYSNEGKISGDIILNKNGVDLTYSKSFVFEIIPEKCSPILTHGDSNDKIDIVIMGAEYANLEEFKSDTEKYLDFDGENGGLFSVSPFNQNIEKFNFYRINELYTLNNLKCTLGCHGVDSMICCDNPAISSAAVQCPSYDQIILLVNKDEFCASSFGISSKVCTGNKNDILSLTHEFGHAFGGLGDEYSYNLYPDMDNLGRGYNFPNCVDDCIKWPENIQAGCFETCGYPEYYRSTDDECIMSDYVTNFCPICSSHISGILKNYELDQTPNYGEQLAPPIKKQYVAELNYNQKKITLNRLYLSPGQASDRRIERGNYLIKIISKNDSLISSFIVDIPAPMFPFYEKNSTSKPAIIELEEFNYTINLPYFDEAKNIKVYDENESKILDLDVSYFASTCGNNVCENYENYLECSSDCSQNSDDICTPEEDNVCDNKCGDVDPDCRSYIWVYVTAGIILAAAILIFVYLMRKRRIN